MRRRLNIDDGLNRQEHQLVYSYLPGKVLAYSPNIPGHRSKFLNGRVEYPRMQSTPSITRDFEVEVGQKVKSLLPRIFEGKDLVFYALDSSISPQLEIFPRVLEIHLADRRKLLYWLEDDAVQTNHSGNLDNLRRVLNGERVLGSFFTDLVFCDSKNEMGRRSNARLYPIHQLDRPRFVPSGSRAWIEGDENWRNRSLRFESPGQDVLLKPMALYPASFAEYDEPAMVHRWFAAPKKARGRETYVPLIFDEIFYNISELQHGIEPDYVLDWLSLKYGDCRKKLSDAELERVRANIGCLVSDQPLDGLTTSLLTPILTFLGIGDNVEQVRAYVSEYKTNIEYLRLMSIKRKVDVLLPSQIEEKQQLPEWLKTDENSAARIASALRDHNVEYIGHSGKIRVVTFVYGWMSGSYDDDNFIFQLPVNCQPAQWPVLYYQFDTEGLLIGFDNEFLTKAFDNEEIRKLLSNLGISDIRAAKRAFLHTVSHVMIKALPVYCGVESGMLGERIYYEGNYAAIMIFSREPGEVKLGGMRDTIRRNLREWIDSWDSLVSCPLEDADEDGCHYCTYIANGCCDFNKHLSRQLASALFALMKSTKRS